MIVEEAAEILEGQLVAVIPSSVQHLIMIGDHKQLKPVVYVVVNFLSQLIFIFPLFWGMVMYANEF